MTSILKEHSLIPKLCLWFWISKDQYSWAQYFLRCIDHPISISKMLSTSSNSKHFSKTNLFLMLPYMQEIYNGNNICQVNF